MGPRFYVSSERLEKPRIELMTPGLEGKWLNHYATEALYQNRTFQNTPTKMMNDHNGEQRG